MNGTAKETETMEAQAIAIDVVIDGEEMAAIENAVNVLMASETFVRTGPGCATLETLRNLSNVIRARARQAKDWTVDLTVDDGDDDGPMPNESFDVKATSAAAAAELGRRFAVEEMDVTNAIHVDVFGESTESFVTTKEAKGITRVES